MDNMQVNRSSQAMDLGQANTVQSGPTLDLPGGGSAQIMSGQAYNDLLQTIGGTSPLGDGKGDDVARLMADMRAAMAGSAAGSTFRLI